MTWRVIAMRRPASESGAARLSTPAISRRLALGSTGPGVRPAPPNHDIQPSSASQAVAHEQVLWTSDQLQEDGQGTGTRTCPKFSFQIGRATCRERVCQYA